MNDRGKIGVVGRKKLDFNERLLHAVELKQTRLFWPCFP